MRIVLAALIVLAFALPVSAAPTLEFDLALSNVTGLLSPGESFNFTVRLKGLKPARGEELAAVFESAAFPSRLVSFEPDESPQALAASTKLSSKPPALNTASQPIRVEVTVARLSGMRLHTVLQRVAYLTVGVPTAVSDGAQPASAPPKNLLASLLKDAPDVDRNGQPVQPLLPPDDIREEHLGESPVTISGPVYWKQIRETVTKRWQQELALLRKGSEGQGVRVQFRLYPTGFAQLIQIERSSGNANTDETALRTVLSLHPFPPFPPDIHDPSVDVHLDLPSPKR